MISELSRVELVRNGLKGTGWKVEALKYLDAEVAKQTTNQSDLNTAWMDGIKFKGSQDSKDKLAKTVDINAWKAQTKTLKDEKERIDASYKKYVTETLSEFGKFKSS